MSTLSLAALVVLLVAGGESGAAEPFQGEVLEERSWTKIQYVSGASEAFKLVRPVKRTWENDLAISPSLILLTLQDRTRIQIDPTQVTLLRYYGVGYKTDKTTKALTVAVWGPLGFLTWRVPKDHFILMEYQLPDGRPSGVLLRAHKSNFKEILDALAAATKTPVTAPSDQGTGNRRK